MRMMLIMKLLSTNNLNLRNYEKIENCQKHIARDFILFHVCYSGKSHGTKYDSYREGYLCNVFQPVECKS